MKNILLLFTLLLSITEVSGQNYYMASPQGFGEATTGGGNVTAITVSNYTDFKAAIKVATPQVILVSGTITIPSGQPISEVVINKSIIGLPGARLVNNNLTQSGSGILNLKNGSNNVIIRNLIFEGPGAYDVDGRDNLTSDGCTNLWVDHCEFQDGIDGNFDIKGNSDNVTVSWCKFTYLKPAIPGGPGGSNDHRFSNLVGSSDSDAPLDGRFSVTFQNCYWADGCKERMPRARNAELHILNCYYNTNVSSSRALGLGGGVSGTTCYVEKTNFAKIGTVYNHSGGSVSLKFVDCINGVSNVGTVAQPSYSYTTIPVADVETSITNTSCGAGATLQVSNTGEISSSCDDSLGLDELALLGIKYYPTLVDNTFNIEFPSNFYENAKISIHSLKGETLYSNPIEKVSNQKISIDLSHLATGIYFCKLQISNVIETIKILKK